MSSALSPGCICKIFFGAPFGKSESMKETSFFKGNVRDITIFHKVSISIYSISH